MRAKDTACPVAFEAPLRRKTTLTYGPFLLAFCALFTTSVKGQEVKLTPSDRDESVEFGVSVSLSGDGQTALVGDPESDESVTNSGSAYVFIRSGSEWTEMTKLKASDPKEEVGFGASVSLSGDGQTALVGAPGYESSSRPGSAYAFTRDGDEWTEVAKLTASDAEVDVAFGFVSLSDDGQTALVGAPSDEGGSSPGDAYVFVRSGSGWTEMAKLTAPDVGADVAFGYVSLSGDGRTALIGAFDVEDSGAYVFARSESGWEQTAKLTPSDSDLFDVGILASLSDDGQTALVGVSSGSAYVFTRSGSDWTEMAKLTPPNGAVTDDFTPVSLSGDGQTAIIGTVIDDDDIDSGSAYVFKRSGSGWTEAVKLSPSDGGASDDFGFSVSLSDDGQTALVGAIYNDEKGSAYIYELSTATSTESEVTPKQFALVSAYPNPFTKRTAIRFELPQPTEIRLDVYDVLGRRVAVLVEGWQAAGTHEAVFDAAALPSGVYLYRLESEGQQKNGRMLLVK